MMRGVVYALGLSLAAASAGEPLGTIVRLLGDMKSKVAAESEQATKEMTQYKEWCRQTNQETAHNIDRNNDDISKFSATLAKANSEIESLSASIADLAAKIASDSADLDKATTLRKEQNDDFVAGEKELEETIDTLIRAAGVLRKAGLGKRADVKAALTQVVNSLSVVMDAVRVDSADKQRLQGLIQAAQKDDDGDDAGFVEPTASAYESHSFDIIETLEELKGKAEAELSDLRKEEMERLHQFETLRQGLSDGISTQERDRKADAGSLAQNQEIKGKAEGDLAAEKNDLSTNEKFLADTQDECSNKAADHAAATKSRNEEIAAITEALRILEETMAGANAHFEEAGTGNKASLLQVVDGSEPARDRVVQLLKSVARKSRSVELAQLALRAQDDTFGKVKGLIRDMISRLQKKAAAEADHNAYCNSERKESKAKRDDISAKNSNFRARLQSAQADESQLKEDVSELSSEVAELDAATAQATEMRQEEQRQFTANAAGFTVANEGLSRAIETLRGYYASKGAASHEKKHDSGSGVIAMLETAMQDMTNSQAEAELAEKNAVASFDKMMQESATSKANKQAATKAKSAELARLGQAIADLGNDVEGSQQELDSVLAYLEKLKGMCEHKPQSFADRAAARQNEIAGLKQALEILENETAGSFMQK